MAELTEFSKQWGKDGNDEQSNLDAFRLLSQKNFDARKLFEDVSSINVKVTCKHLAAMYMQQSPIYDFIFCLGG